MRTEAKSPELGSSNTMAYALNKARMLAQTALASGDAVYTCIGFMCLWEPYSLNGNWIEISNLVCPGAMSSEVFIWTFVS